MVHYDEIFFLSLSYERRRKRSRSRSRWRRSIFIRQRRRRMVRLRRRRRRRRMVGWRKVDLFLADVLDVHRTVLLPVLLRHNVEVHLTP